MTFVRRFCDSSQQRMHGPHPSPNRFKSEGAAPKRSGFRNLFKKKSRAQKFLEKGAATFQQPLLSLSEPRSEAKMADSGIQTAVTHAYAPHALTTLALDTVNLNPISVCRTDSYCRHRCRCFAATRNFHLHHQQHYQQHRWGCGHGRRGGAG